MSGAFKLDDICEFIIDTKHKTPKFTESGYPCIRTPNIGRGFFILENAKYVDKDSYIEWTTRAVPEENDLILAREAPVGNVAIVPSGLRVCHGQRTVLIRPNRKKVNPHYLMYLMLGDEVQADMHSMASGATVAHLNMSDIRALKLPELPGISKQEEIAGILKAYDSLIENNNRRIAILEDMAQSLYREWFVKFRYPGHENQTFIDSPLGPIPEGWEVKTLKDVIELAYGRALKKNDRKGGDVAVYGSGGLGGWHNQVLVLGPSIIVGRKGNVGKVFWVEEDCWPIDTVFYVVSDYSKYYLYYNLLNQVFHNSDAAVPGLNRDSAYSNRILIPSRDVISEFERVVASLFAQLKNLRNKNRNLRKQRDMLLPKLISGTITL